MFKNLSYFFIIFSIISNFYISAQIPVGTWRDHLPYYNITGLAATGEKIYCSSPYALFDYNISDFSVNKLSRSNGLSDVGISTINFNVTSNVLMVAYENANIDMIYGSGIYNLGDIKNKQIQGDKKIYQIVFVENLAYLACGFGIVVIDIDKKEVKDTYYIGNEASAVGVYSIAFDETSIYAATGSGIYKALKNNPVLIDYKQWHKISNLPNPNGSYTHLINYNSDIYVVLYNGTLTPNSVIYRQTSGNWLLAYSPGEIVKNIKVLGDKLYVVDEKGISILNSNMTLDQRISDYGFTNCEANDVLLANDGKLYIGDEFYGLITKSQNSNYTSFIPNSPYNNHVSDIDAQKNQVVAVGGGHTSYGGSLGHFGELYTFSNELWSNNILWNSNARDFSTVLINPYNNSQVFAAAWGAGVYVFENGQLLTNYNETNSSLQSIFPGSDYIRIGGILVDQSQNLYVTNQGVQKPISVKVSDGNWSAFTYPGLVGTGEVADIIETQDGSKWVQLSRGGGLFAFNENYTPGNTADDTYKKFSIYDETGQFATNEVFSLAEDENGVVWVGTNMGVYTYFNPAEVFSADQFLASRVKVFEVDNPNSGQFLLTKDRINAIAIDGANRKWFGTENSGVYLMSDDCEQEIFHFTKSNSKLLSDNIVSIAIEPQTGEVFFGTDKGVCSFKSTATKGDDTYKEAYVYPNPVRENYDGPITITGLAANVDVKITDIAGQIVYQTKAFGGQAIWNGKNYSGKRVQTGIYLVFCTDETGENTKVLKLLFVN